VHIEVLAQAQAKGALALAALCGLNYLEYADSIGWTELKALAFRLQMLQL